MPPPNYCIKQNANRVVPDFVESIDEATAYGLLLSEFHASSYLYRPKQMHANDTSIKRQISDQSAPEIVVNNEPVDIDANSASME